MPPPLFNVRAALPLLRRATFLFLGAIPFVLGVSPVQAQSADRIWGRVYTQQGNTHEGFIELRGSWSAASWADIFEARRTIPDEHYLDWIDATRDGNPPTRTIELKGYRVSWDERDPAFATTASTGVQVGQLAALITTDEGDVEVVPRSGVGRLTLTGPGVMTKTVNISLTGVRTSSTWDPGGVWRRSGVRVEVPGSLPVRINGNNVRRIEFAAPPPGAGSEFRRLHGTVRDRSGRSFTGFISWQGRVFQVHDLHGFDSDRDDRGITFSQIQAVERNRGDARVTLVTGEVVEIDEHGWGHRGVRVADPALGTVRVEWDGFHSLQLDESPADLGYDSFDGGHPLFGTVVTQQGEEITGRIRWDADEEWSWELLNGRSDDVDFQIEFGNIEHIEANEDGGARVTLLDGRSFELGGSNDVSADNKGIFVFPTSNEISEAERDSDHHEWRYVSWEDFREVRFQHALPEAGS